MRSLSAEFRAKLDVGVTTLAHVWVVTRRDGRRFAFTDHDEDVVFDGLTAPAASGLTPLAVEKSSGLAPDGAGAEGALSHEALTPEDLAAGLWDGAQVTLHRVDWTAPALAAHLFAGRIGEVRRSDGRFTAELRGLKAGFDRSIGRVYARTCDAELGDARCGIDLADPRFAGASCDKAFATCRDRFANALNFRGFPHTPGPDAMLAPIRAGETQDGGSRWD